jgi:hypothetical protein
MKIKHKIITISLIILTVFTTILTPAKATTNEVLYKWSQTYGSIDPDSTVAIAEGTDGSIYVTGYFTDTVDFDGTAGVDNRTSNGYHDSFITKLQQSLATPWTQNGGLTSHAIATKAFDGKIYQAIKGNSTNTIYVRSSTDGIN